MADQNPSSSSDRAATILDVFTQAFGTLMAGDPSAFQAKFRKMAATSFAFYRGSACLFYHDLQHQRRTQSQSQSSSPSSAFLNDRTGRIWIHGDLHAENFGTYMDAEGRLVFNVNDFDEAYVGPFLWDVQRFAASVALVGYVKVLSDEQISGLVAAYADAYADRIAEVVGAGGDSGAVPRFTLATARGPLLEALRDARAQTRAGLLDSMTEVREGAERRFVRSGGGAFELDEDTRAQVLAAFEGYLGTLPEDAAGRRGRGMAAAQVKDVVGRRGVGIGSAGLPSYNLLLEGTTEALENDVVLYMKASQPAAVARHLEAHEHEGARGHFRHEGHRTVLSERALQSHADPWLGWAEMGPEGGEKKGLLVAEVSPYAVDLDWADINDPAEMREVVADLGRATAMMHAAGDDDRQHSDVVPFSPEEEIHAVVGPRRDEFVRCLVDFAHSYSAQVRRDHAIFVDLFRNSRIPGLDGN